MVAAGARATRRRTERDRDRARRRRVRAARVLRLRHRHADDRRARGRRGAPRQLPHHRAVLADARLPAHRPQPPLRRDGTRRRPGHRLSGSPGHHRPPMASSPRPWRRRAMPRYAVGKWHLTPEDETDMAASRRTWPIARGFQRWYGYHGGETHQFVPTLYQDNQWVPPASARRRLPPQRGSGRSRDRVPRRSARRRPGPAVLPLPRDGCMPFAAPRAAGLDRTVRGQLRPRLGRVARADVRPPTSLGLLPEGTELSPRPPWVPAWDDLSADEQEVAARFMECFAAFLSHADAQIGRVLDFVEPGSVCSTTRSSYWCPTTGRRPKAARSARSTTRACGTGSLPVGPSSTPGSTRSVGRPRTTTTRGAGPWRATRRSVVGSARCTKAASPIRASCGGPPASPRRGESAATTRTPSMCCRRCWTWSATSARAHRRRRPVADRGGELRRGARRRRRRGTRTTQYFEMLGSRAIYHDGWKAVTFKPLAAMYDDGIDPDAPFDDDRWELYHVAVDFSECHDLRGRGARAARGDGRAVVAGGPVAPGAASRQPPAGGVEAATHPSPRTVAYTSTSRAGRPCPNPSRSTSAIARTRLSSMSTCPPASRSTGCCSPRAPCSAAGASSWSTARCATSTTSRASSGTGSTRAPTVPPVGISSASSSPGPPTSQGRSPAGRRRGRGRGRDPVLDAGAVLDHRFRAHVWLRGRSRRVRRLRRAPPLHRHDPAGRRRRQRPALPGPQS